MIGSTVYPAVVEPVPKNEPKLHHFLPQAYLRGFTDAEGVLWVCDRKRGEVRPQRPANTGAEQDMYTRERGETRNRDVERVLADMVDGPASAVIRHLITQQPLRDDQRLGLALFAASLFLRTPMFRAANRQMSEQMRGWLGRMNAPFANRPRNATPPLPTPGERGVRTEDLLQWLEQAGTLPRPFQNEFVNSMIGLLGPITQVMLSLHWIIAYAPQGESFITSDAPVVLSRPENLSPLLGAGLTTPGSEKAFPLSSGVALLMRDMCEELCRVEYGVIQRERLRILNEAFVYQSERFSIGNSKALLESLMNTTGVANTPPPPRSHLSGADDDPPARMPPLDVRETGGDGH